MVVIVHGAVQNFEPLGSFAGAASTVDVLYISQIKPVNQNTLMQLIR
jgi:hypothetical protein